LGQTGYPKKGVGRDYWIPSTFGANYRS